MMPSSPTESGGPGTEGVPGQPQAPTAGTQQPGAAGTGEASSATMQAMGPMLPTANQRRTSMPMGSLPSLGSAGQLPRPSMIGGAAPQTTDKPHSNYQPGASGVSPWLNLFRRDTIDIDNYNTLVRPEFDQRKQNRQVRGDISGLQRNSRLQGMSLQQMNQQNRTLQGVGTPQFYMNYGNYYPYQGQGGGP